MSIPTKDKAQRGEPNDDSLSGANAKSSAQKDTSSPAGRIVHDSRGNAVWSWGGDSGATASTSKMLKKLDLGNLSVQDDSVQDDAARPEKQPDTKKRASSYGPGYNPYDRTAPVRVMPPKKDPSRS